MANHAMIFEKHTAVRKGRVHDGKVMVMRSNLRWCSDGLEFTCWNGEVVRLAFIIDAFDREIISWAAVVLRPSIWSLASRRSPALNQRSRHHDAPCWIC